MSDIYTAVFTATAVCFALIIYLIPAIVASQRNHANMLAITWLNILLGWTFLGWVIAFVWACTNNVLPHEQVGENAYAN